MKIFISYSSKDKDIAEQTGLALISEGFDVFIDKYNLTASEDFNINIEKNVKSSDFLIFLISPDSVSQNSYALTELALFRKKWKHPKNRLLPVIVREVEYGKIPNFLKAVTILEPKGYIPKEITGAVKKLNIRFHKTKKYILFSTIVLMLIAGSYIYFNEIPNCPDPPVYNGTIAFDDNMSKIESGSFIMGSEELHEIPAFQTHVDNFYIDKYKVTNRQYQKFVRVTNHKSPRHWVDGDIPSGEEFFPVVNVDWNDAVSYCAWKSKRLPTEAEWEKTCRGKENYLYPWGNKDNINLSNTNGVCGQISVPVGSFFKRNAQNLLHGTGFYLPGFLKKSNDDYKVAGLYGNTQEWTSSKSTPYPYKKQDGREDLTDKTSMRIIRGRSYKSHPNTTTCLERTYTPIKVSMPEIGFRCAKDT